MPTPAIRLATSRERVRCSCEQGPTLAAMRHEFEPCNATENRRAEELKHFKCDEAQKVLSLAWYGSLERGVPTQVSSYCISIELNTSQSHK
ncbi:hypothetical protein TNCV_1701681 [Trichonephila clavipes]|nr:hypothetical protein TNCV_1701681 [Trichonephila clavipes]